MMDLSFGKDEKEYYIVNVKLKDDGQNFIVFYADGHTEEFPFLVHNFNVYIYRMKHQVLDNRKKYEDTLNFIGNLTLVKEFKTLLLSLAGFVFTTNIEIPNMLKIIVIGLIALYNAGYALGRILELLAIKLKLTECKKLDEFVKIMEKFRIDVIDPATLKEEDWYLFNIGDVDINTNISFLKVMSLGMTDEFKRIESERINELLKEQHEMNLAKKPKEV